MAAAQVGDDVYGEDPTINRLEARAAEVLEREAALFVPSGTMGNQIAVHLQASRASEVIGEAGCHVFNFEMGAMAALSGALPRAVPAAGGILDSNAVEAAIQPPAGYRTRTSLLILENSHNLAGGRVTPPPRMAELTTLAHRHGLPVHLDGARIFNAAAALDIPPARVADGCDTIMFCLSKGLAAPVGSMLVGDSDLIAEARRVRKMLGGGMRQAGILAAAGLVALDEMAPRVAEDNHSARVLAEGIADARGIVLDPDTVDTNIVFFHVSRDAPMDARELAASLTSQGVLVHALGPDSIRMVTHYQVSLDDVRWVAEVVHRTLSGA